jgi:bacteriocin biosynthesis cyclodehydratase domain-containing protein
VRTRPSAPSPLRRLVLRPGVHVLRRSASEVQVGLDPRRAVVLPDVPGVRALLDRLTSPASAPAAHQYTGEALEALADSGLLMDVDLLLPLAPAPPRGAGAVNGSGPATSPVSRAAVAALAAEAGDRVGELLARRSAAAVEVASCGSPEAADVAAEVVAFLASAGLDPRRVAHGRPPGEELARGRSTVAGLLVAVGEPAREHVDGWMRSATPHLLLRLVEGAAVVGPFVLPGETACIRCLDAHHTDLDPAWPLLVTQYATAVTRQREDTVPEPVDPLLATLAAAWTAKELVAHTDGRVPATASATLRLDPRLTALENHRWPRHPACGCAWS